MYGTSIYHLHTDYVPVMQAEIDSIVAVFDRADLSPEQKVAGTHDLLGTDHRPHTVTIMIGANKRGPKYTDLTVIDLPRPWGYQVVSSDGSTLYACTVPPHVEPSCGCDSGQHGFGGCTKTKYCKHVHAARVRACHRIWPSCAHEPQTLAYVYERLYHDADPEPVEVEQTAF